MNQASVAGPLETADAITDHLMTALLDDLPHDEGDRFDILVNGLGATPPEELYIVCNRVFTRLEERGLRPRRAWVGEYATSLEMAGMSLSLLRLDDELVRLLDAPGVLAFPDASMTSLVEVLGIVAASLKDRADELNRLDARSRRRRPRRYVTAAGEAVNRSTADVGRQEPLRCAQRLRSYRCKRSPINFGDLARDRAHGSRESGQSEFLLGGCGAGGAARCITGIDRQTRQGRAGLEDNVGRFGACGTSGDHERAGGRLAFGGPGCRCSGCGPRRASDTEHGPSARSRGLAPREVSWA